MKRAAILTFVLLAAGPPDPHPLTETQRAQLESVKDNSPTPDESAFYALLENAADWSSKESGAVVADYDSIRRNPESWRGTRCLIEGTVAKVITDLNLTRQGWEKVQGVVVRLEHAQEQEAPEAFVIVYLTHPPAWDWHDYQKGIPWEATGRVRVVARFYKPLKDIAQRNPQGQTIWNSYLTFVGNSVTSLEDPHALPPPRSSRFTLITMAGGIFILLAFLIWRAKALLGRGGERESQVQSYIQQRRLQRQAAGDVAMEETTDIADELPDNPADALGTLDQKHENPTQEN